MPAELPSEAALRDLARRFDDVERRVRLLVAEAPDGNRRNLLAEALQLLADLRRQAPQDDVGAAYLIARDAVHRLQNREAGNRDMRPVRDLAGSLARKLDDAAKEASQRVRQAIRIVTDETVDELAHDAVTAHVDNAGRRQTLGPYAAAMTATIGRHATSRGTRDGLGSGGLVVISAHATENPICMPKEGQTFPADGGLPPFHKNCQHIASPAGYSLDAFTGAMAETA